MAPTGCKTAPPGVTAWGMWAGFGAEGAGCREGLLGAIADLE